MWRRFFPYFTLYALLIVTTLPLIAGVVPPNRWYGFRLSLLNPSPEIWYQVNALGGKMFLAALLACMGINLLLLWKAPPTVLNLLGWINAGLIAFSFWLVSVELVQLFQ